MFRLTDPQEGTIKIDSVDIEDIGLHFLRSSIAYIPQQPFFIQGTLRENLDPFQEKSDSEIWQILEEVKLDQIVRDLSKGLAT